MAPTGFLDAARCYDTTKHDVVSQALRMAAFLVSMPPSALQWNVGMIRRITACMDEHLLSRMDQSKWTRSTLMPMVTRMLPFGRAVVCQQQTGPKAFTNAVEICMPHNCVSTTALGAVVGTSACGQSLLERYSACGEHEDTLSMALTALRRLILWGGVQPKEIGQLTFGSASVMDHSKSMKT